MRRFAFLLLSGCNALTGIDDYSTGVRDGGAPVDSGPQCGAGTLLCPTTGTCESSCATCDGGPIECFACSPAAIGHCYSASDTKSCISDMTYPHCSCKLPTDCPGASQACVLRAGMNKDCKTCGENGTDGLPCKNGKTCSAAMRICM